VYNRTIDFYAVYNVLFRFSEALSFIVALSISLVIFPFISISAIENIVERAEKLNVRVNPKLVKDYVDGCFMVFLLSTVEIVLMIAIQLIESIPIITLTAFTLLLTLIIVLFTIVYSLWKAARLLQEAVEKS